MEFALSEEQRMLQDSVRRFLEQNSPLDKVRLAAGNTHTVQRSLWAGASELGIPGMLIPEDFGGMGLGFLDAAIVYEMFGRYVAPLPFLGTAVMAPLALMPNQSLDLRTEASARATANVLRAAIRDGVRAGRPSCRTELDEVDDETYVHDGVPLPE